MITMFEQNDTARLMNDLGVVISTLVPDIEMQQLLVRLEEVLTNYEIKRKTELELEDDFQEKIEMYINAKQIENYSELTLMGYRIELNLFANFVKKATAQVTTIDIRKYLASNNNLKASTIDKKLSCIKAFYAWLVEEELQLRNPAAKIKPPKKPKRLPKALTLEELEIVRESCETLRERALVETMYSTGCRLSEIANMKISDVNFQTMKIHVVGKGDKERTVHLSPRAVYHLRKYLESRNDDCEYLFATVRRPIRKLNNRTIQDIIDKIEKRANLPKKLTPHVFRHTFATLGVNNGMELVDLQKLLGHEDPSTTLVYGDVSETRKELAFKRHHVQ